MQPDVHRLRVVLVIAIVGYDDQVAAGSEQPYQSGEDSAPILEYADRVGDRDHVNDASVRRGSSTSRSSKLMSGWSLNRSTKSGCSTGAESMPRVGPNLEALEQEPDELPIARSGIKDTPA